MQNNYQAGQPINQKPAAMIDPMQNTNYTFKFLSYYFDKQSLTGTFVYQGIDNTIFTEKIIFAKHPEAHKGKHFNAIDDPRLNKILDRAMFLAFILLGTSYYKAHPTPFVTMSQKLDDFQANFFNKVFQEGFSQYAFENGLVRDNLAHFRATPGYKAEDPIQYKGNGVLSLQSGGKDSLLLATLLLEAGIDFTPWYVSSDPQGAHPSVLDQLFPQLTHKNASITIRHIDHNNLQVSGGLNGHVPVTFINEALALIQAILNNQNVVLTSIGQEGTEPHAMIGDLPVNHQWSKTWEAEVLMAEYIKRYISEDIHLGSPLRKYSELRIAELFVTKCWKKYGYKFSSCNQANYRQGQKNGQLSWCGECAKCANTYILFCPFLAPHILQSLFNDTDLYRKPTLIKTFKGLLGVDNEMKPFECIGSVDELRFAYAHRMQIAPIRTLDSSSIARNYRMEQTNANFVQASERLGVNKWFSGPKTPPTPTYNPNGNNGQYGTSYGQQKGVKVDEKPPVVEQRYDQNGNPLPPQLPEGWWQPLYADLPFMIPQSNFNYTYEFECQDFFKNYLEDNRNPVSIGE